MKKIFYFLAIVAISACTIIGCKPKDPVEDPNTDKDTTKVDTTKVDTPEVVVTTPTLKIEISDISATTAHVTITPSDTNVYYFFAYDSYSNWVELGYANNDEYAMSDDLRYWLDDYNANQEYYAQYGYSSFEEYYLYQGAVAGNLNEMKPETEYIAYAYFVTISEKDTIPSGITYQRFTTDKAVMSDMTFTLEVIDSANISIVPSNNDPYFAVVVEDSAFNASAEEFGYEGDKVKAFDDEIDWLSTMSRYFGEELTPITGATTLNVAESVYEDGLYHILVAGWNGEYRTTDEVSEITMDVVAVEAEVETPIENAPAKKVQLRKTSSKRTLSK